VDTRTPEELMDIIEAKGREVAAALAALRNGSTLSMEAIARSTTHAEG
jgi:hypothetical protein